MTNILRTAKDFTVEERNRFLAQFRTSGLEYQEFAREHNISAQTMKNWLWWEKRPIIRVYTPTERKKIIEAYLSAKISKDDFAKVWGVSTTTLLKWVRRYEEYGCNGLMNKSGWDGDKRIGSRIAPTVANEIICLKKKEPAFGLKKMKQWLYRFRGVTVSTGSIRKTMVKEGLPLVKKSRKRRRNSDRVRRFERARPMQLWQSDITQFTLGPSSMRVYLTVFMDDHSRYIVSWRLQSRQTVDLVIDAFKDGIVRFGKPVEVLTDQGRQYFAWRGKSELEKLLEKEGIKHVVSRAHHPQTLGKCERFWETVTNEFWTRVKPLDLDEARARLKYFIDHYNHQRPHQGIGGQVPADRFFGIAEEVRGAIEKTVTENALKLALGVLPQPPAFLIGQVGDQRIAFHGTSGKFYLTHENIEGEKYGDFSRDQSQSNSATAMSAQDDNREVSSDPSEGAMGESFSGGAGAGPSKSTSNNGVLAGAVNEDRGDDEACTEASAVLADDQSGSGRDDGWFINSAAVSQGGAHE